MNFKKYIKHSLILAAFLLPTVSCQDYLDINKDPNAVIDAPIEQVFTSATVGVGFWAGSDMNRYAALIAQQWSGQTAGATVQTQDYEKYLITGSDLNNVWNLMYSGILADLEVVIQKASAAASPNYSGVAKVMKAYIYANIADTWGSAPFSEALKFTSNAQPKFDDASTIYPALITMLNEAITEMNATSAKSPGTNSTIYPGAWSASKAKWIAAANTLKMRLWLHTSKVDKTKAVTEIASIAAGGAVLNSAADNFQMNFVNAANAKNPIEQFEISRSNYLFANATLVDLMNGKADPRRPRYFTDFPFRSGQYKGAKSGDASSQQYSRTHIYLRGDTTNAATAASNGSIAYNAYTYTGTAPIRLLTAAESFFIRAEAAVLSNANIGGMSADSLFRQGIRQSMSAAGVATAAVDAYIAAQGTLTGTEADKVKKIIEEKYVANFGVLNEPWTDWRRTGYPSQIVKVSNAVVTSSSDVPRSLFYPQSEIDLNPNAPKQKVNMVERVYWDK
ncbi:MAG: SusD/RagB family nutrient-binding outer membrane lipoprotein [Saprospiraceae bacterium]|nr:SusD/RagB family nutrient-binding outer membrane lipoprotein [Saprospiraceae bacterium]